MKRTLNLSTKNQSIIESNASKNVLKCATNLIRKQKKTLKSQLRSYNLTKMYINALHLQIFHVVLWLDALLTAAKSNNNKAFNFNK